MLVILSNNTAGDDGSAITAYQSSYPVLRNTILWGNGPDPLFVGGDASITAIYCNIEGGWPGDGKIGSDPLFADRYHGFEHLLSADSPCIDSGDPAILDAVYDTDPRWPGGHVDGPRSDMGMYGGIGNWLWLQ